MRKLSIIIHYSLFTKNLVLYFGQGFCYIIDGVKITRYLLTAYY